MDNPMKIVGIGGSLADFSASLYALEIVLKQTLSMGCITKCYDVDKLRLPMFDTRMTSIPAIAQQFCEDIYTADALVWASPLYHGTISGAFKNTIDWLDLLKDRTPKYLMDKPVALIATAGGVQGLQAINTMEYIVRSLRGWTLPLVVPIAKAWQTFSQDGIIQNELVEQQLIAQGQAIYHAAKRFCL